MIWENEWKETDRLWKVIDFLRARNTKLQKELEEVKANMESNHNLLTGILPPKSKWEEAQDERKQLHKP